MSPRSKKLAEMMKAESRGAILSAALELFAKRGYSATTTDEIAKKAKVSKGLIFAHFGTKQDILLAILDEQIGRLMPGLDDRNDTRPAKEKFISLIDAWVEIVKTEPLLVRLSLQLNLDDEYRKLLKTKGKQYYDAVFSRLRDLLEQLGSRDPDLDCLLLTFIFDGITANYTVAPQMFSIDAIKDHLIKTLLSRWESRT
jgi:AcrR family transcriptional regulator